jgi:hypothetical protein
MLYKYIFVFFKEQNILKVNKTSYFSKYMYKAIEKDFKYGIKTDRKRTSRIKATRKIPSIYM